jgi:hypothetical protein
MSDFNGIKKIDSLRNFYKGQSSYTNNETVGELREIKNELKVANDLTIIEEEKITNASGSPYLKDQPYYNKDVILGSIKETDWKEVKSYEDAKQEVIIFRNLRKLNII